MTVEYLRAPNKLKADDLDRSRISMVSRGNREAFDLLYIDYHRRLSRFLTRFDADYSEIEEVINDTMFTVWNEAGTFDGRSRVSTWIFGIAYNQACNMIRGLNRRRKKYANAAAIAEQNEQGVSSHTDQLIDRRMLDNVMEDLPVEQRLAIELCYLLGYSCEEIGEITCCSPNTVKSRLLAARKLLKEKL